MIAIFSVLIAFPLGFLVRSRTSAMLAYSVIYLWAYGFQTGYLTRAWVEGDTTAFPRPADLGLEYGLVTGAILVVGCLLVAVGHRLAARRRQRKAAAAATDGARTAAEATRTR